MAYNRGQKSFQMVETGAGKNQQSKTTDDLILDETVFIQTMSKKLVHLAQSRLIGEEDKQVLLKCITQVVRGASALLDLLVGMKESKNLNGFMEIFNVAKEAYRVRYFQYARTMKQVQNRINAEPKGIHTKVVIDWSEELFSKMKKFASVSVAVLKSLPDATDGSENVDKFDEELTVLIGDFAEEFNKDVASEKCKPRYACDYCEYHSDKRQNLTLHSRMHEPKPIRHADNYERDPEVQTDKEMAKKDPVGYAIDANSLVSQKKAAVAKEEMSTTPPNLVIAGNGGEGAGSIAAVPRSKSQDGMEKQNAAQSKALKKRRSHGISGCSSRKHTKYDHQEYGMDDEDYNDMQEAFDEDEEDSYIKKN